MKEGRRGYQERRGREVNKQGKNTEASRQKGWKGRKEGRKEGGQKSKKRI
jgi:hypothetical protein